MKNNLVTEDYRYNRYCNISFVLSEKKERFSEFFRASHPRTSNFYKYISPRKSVENRMFREIYNNRCVYCGVSTQVLPASLFEVDHFLSQSECVKHSIANVNYIDNLVSSCSMCNRGKSNYSCSSEYVDLLHPDKNQYPVVFKRDKRYNLEIKEIYQNNPDVVELFRVLKFDNELRRIDYLIMELKDFCKIYPEDSLVCQIKDIIEPIEQHRRDNSI